MSEQSEKRRFPELKKRRDGKSPDYEKRTEELRAELPFLTRLFKKEAVRRINPDSLRAQDIAEQNAAADLIERQLVGAMLDPDPHSIGSFLSSHVSRDILPSAIVSEDASGRLIATAFKFCINELNKQLGLNLKNIPVIPFTSGRIVRRPQVREEQAKKVVTILEKGYDLSRPVLYITDVIASGRSIYPFIRTFFHNAEFLEGPNPNWKHEATRLAVISQDKTFSLQLQERDRRVLGHEFEPLEKIPEAKPKNSFHIPGLRSFSSGLSLRIVRDTFRAIERDTTESGKLIPVETVEDRKLRMEHLKRMGKNMANALLSREELRVASRMNSNS